MIRDDLLRQIADHSSDPSFILGLTQLPNPDEVLRKAGLTEKVFDQVLTDSHVMSKVIDRRSGLLRREWKVEAGGDGPKEKTAAELCRMALAEMEEHETHPLENSIGHLQEAVFRGHRALEVVWRYVGGVWLPDFLRDIPNRRLIHTGVEWRLLTIDNQYFGEQFPEKKVLLAAHMPSTDNPYGEALLSRCFWPYTFKHSGMKWWVTLAEKYGLPWIIGKLGGSTDDKERRDLLNQLVALAVDAITVVPRDAEMEFKEISGSTQEIHSGLVAVCNGEISKVIVGQTLSTELDGKGGSRAAAETHSDLRDEIVDADGKMVGRTINRLFAWITEITLGPNVSPPKFKWVEEDQPPKDWAEVADKAISAMPGKVPRRWAWEKFGIPEEMANEEMLPASQQPATGKEDTASFARETDDQFTEEQQALEALADGGIEEAVSAIAANEERFVAIIQEADSYDEAKEMLLSVYPELDVSGLEEVLARVFLAAGMFGRFTVQEEGK